MFTILHGDNKVKIYSARSQLVERAKKDDREILSIASKDISIAFLETLLGTTSLYVPKRLVCIENLLAMPKSKKKQEYIDWLLPYADSKDLDVVFVESKVLTPLQLKSVMKASVQLFKLPALLFSWLENLGVVSKKETLKQFHLILAQEDPFFVFTMLTRQVRLLLQYVSDGTIDGPPFVKNKVSKQARAFSMEKLLSLHHELLEIDLKVKSSDLLDLVALLDLFISTM